MPSQMPSAAERRGPVRAPQSLVAGLALIALCAFALWLTRDLPQGTLRAMGPAMLPRWLAIGIGLCGVALVVLGFVSDGEPVEGTVWRGPILVLLGVGAFAVTIRGFGPIPALGMIFAGPISMLIGGFATPEVRLRELLVLAFALTAACMILFGDLLNLPIPLYPLWLGDLFPAGWTNDGRLRGAAGILFALAVVFWLAGRVRARPAEAPVRLDVADHSGRI